MSDPRPQADLKPFPCEDATAEDSSIQALLHSQLLDLVPIGVAVLQQVSGPGEGSWKLRVVNSLAARLVGSSVEDFTDGNMRAKLQMSGVPCQEQYAEIIRSNERRLLGQLIRPDGAPLRTYFVHGFPL